MTVEPGSADALLRRIERRACWLAAIATVTAAVWPAPVGGLRAAGGVLGGALLAFTSYWAIKRGVGGIATAVLRQQRPRQRSGGLLFVLRYALLAGMAYVMIARLRLPPMGLLSGASVTMLAAAAELVRGRR